MICARTYRFQVCTYRFQVCTAFLVCKIGLQNLRIVGDIATMVNQFTWLNAANHVELEEKEAQYRAVFDAFALNLLATSDV